MFIRRIVHALYDWVRLKPLPIQITENELLEIIGPEIEAFRFHFSMINGCLYRDTNIWMELIPCPAISTHPSTFYLTVYYEGQKSLFFDARAPQAGPYWIPDHFRS